MNPTVKYWTVWAGIWGIFTHKLWRLRMNYDERTKATANVTNKPAETKHSRVGVRLVCRQTENCPVRGSGRPPLLWSTGCGGHDGKDTVMGTTQLHLDNTNVTSAKDAASTSLSHTHTHRCNHNIRGPAQPWKSRLSTVCLDFRC